MRILLFGLLIIAVRGEGNKAPLGVGDEGVKVEAVPRKVVAPAVAGKNASTANSVPKDKIPNPVPKMSKAKSKELMSQPITSVVWTREKEPKIHTGSGKSGKRPIAFRWEF